LGNEGSNRWVLHPQLNRPGFGRLSSDSRYGLGWSAFGKLITLLVRKKMRLDSGYNSARPKNQLAAPLELLGIPIKGRGQ
jgi:hypothetical protein